MNPELLSDFKPCLSKGYAKCQNGRQEATVNSLNDEFSRLRKSTKNFEFEFIKTIQMVLFPHYWIEKDLIREL